MNSILHYFSSHSTYIPIQTAKPHSFASFTHKTQHDAIKTWIFNTSVNSFDESLSRMLFCSHKEQNQLAELDAHYHYQQSQEVVGVETVAMELRHGGFSSIKNISIWQAFLPFNWH
jgi:hypothetical protein